MRSGVPRRMLLHGGLSCWKGRRERESEGGIRASKGGYEEKERPGQREDQATAPRKRSLNSSRPSPGKRPSWNTAGSGGRSGSARPVRCPLPTSPLTSPVPSAEERSCHCCYTLQTDAATSRNLGRRHLLVLHSRACDSPESGVASVDREV